jgi:hypothetical protein
LSEKLQAYYDLIGDLVKDFRTQQNMPVWMLALLAGVRPNDIVRLEDGNPGVQSNYFLSKIARALGIPVESIQPSEGW